MKLKALRLCLQACMAVPGDKLPGLLIAGCQQVVAWLQARCWAGRHIGRAAACFAAVPGRCCWLHCCTAWFCSSVWQGLGASSDLMQV